MFYRTITLKQSSFFKKVFSYENSHKYAKRKESKGSVEKPCASILQLRRLSWLCPHCLPTCLPTSLARSGVLARVPLKWNILTFEWFRDPSVSKEEVCFR